MSTKPAFRERLRTDLAVQRWDDHRLYHSSRINQSLHFFSGCTFLACYALLAINPVISGWLGLLVAWTSRQVGHFFFEPKDYDLVNRMSHEEKEEIKVGYNLTRKVGLLAAFIASPIVLYFSPDLFGLIRPYTDGGSYFNDLSLLWLALALAALLFRTVQLFFIRDVWTGLVWATKIITDPINDIRIYWKSPYYLLRGELIDPELDGRLHV